MLEASPNKKDLLQVKFVQQIKILPTCSFAKDLLLERGVIPEMDAPSHQFALIAKENDVDDSPNGIRNTTKEKKEELDWVISELGYDQASFLVLLCTSYLSLL